MDLGEYLYEQSKIIQKSYIAGYKAGKEADLNAMAEDYARHTCPECGEVRMDDARVEAGMKCTECAYLIH